MAVTSLWPIVGRVDRVINYARNPEKTTEGSYEELAFLHAVDDVVEYAANDMKTERHSYVSCLNYDKDTAAHQFIETKKIWQRVSGRDKMGGRVCFHGYQSFKANEVTAEIVHEIGVKLAREFWGDRGTCNETHYIRADSLEQVVLLELNRMVSYLKNHAEEFAELPAQKTTKDLSGRAGTDGSGSKS